VTDSRAALDRLPSDARSRLRAFAAALERVPVDELGLYADRTWDDAHVAAADRARAVAEDARLTEPIEAAQRALVDGILQSFDTSRLRVSIIGTGVSPSVGTADRKRILDSLADAVTSLVLGDRLDPADAAELLGLWARVLPDS
jgi:hypothetical protein